MNDAYERTFSDSDLVRMEDKICLCAEFTLVGSEYVDYQYYRSIYQCIYCGSHRKVRRLRNRTLPPPPPPPKDQDYGIRI